MRKNGWSKTEKEELARLYPIMTVKRIAERLGRTAYSVAVMASKIGLHKENPCVKHLSREQELWLKLNFPHMATCICATYLGMSHRTVIRKARALGLWKTEQFIRESQMFAAKRAKESNLRNGTHPPKGVVNENLMKGIPYRFKPGHRKKATAGINENSESLKLKES